MEAKLKLLDELSLSVPRVLRCVQAMLVKTSKSWLCSNFLYGGLDMPITAGPGTIVHDDKVTNVSKD